MYQMTKKGLKIMAVALVVAILPIIATAQSKPRITSPSDRSSSVLGNNVNVYVSGNNIEVIYAGIIGNPNPANSNESNFYKGTMYQSGSKFFFTPNTSTWENKWVKIIAHDKVSDGWSDPVYVKINPKPQPGPLPPVQQSVINSFSANKSEYNVGENVSLRGSASNIGSWRVMWMKNGYEADAATAIQNNNNISCGGTVNNTAYNGAILYVYPQANGGGVPIKKVVSFMVKQQIIPSINSFSANKSEYNVGENVSLRGSASNIGSWKVMWMKNGYEADAATAIQNNNNISCSGTVNNTAYNGAILYVFPQLNGGGSPVKKTVNFTVKQQNGTGNNNSPMFTYENKSGVHIVTIDPLSLYAAIVNSITNAIPYPNAVNAGYFDGDLLYLGILVNEGKVLSNSQPHGKPCGTLIVYRDGRVACKPLLTINGENNVWFAVSGCTIMPQIRMNEEGFIGKFSDIGRSTNRPVIGYNPTINKVIIAVRGNSDINTAAATLRNLGCTMGLTLDAGGSTTLKVNNKYYFTGDGRKISGVIHW